MWDICTDPSFLKAVLMGKRIITIVLVFIPLLLIGFGIKDFFKMVMEGNSGAFKDSVKVFSLRVISAILLFFVPVIVSAIFNIIYDSKGIDNSSFLACIGNATEDRIDEIVSGQKCYVCSNDKKYEWSYSKPGIGCSGDWVEDTSLTKDNCVYKASTPTYVRPSGDEIDDGYKEPSGDSKYSTYTNSKNGVTFNLYNQIDEEWASLPVNGNTVGKSGCNLIDTAVIASGYDKTITPKVGYDNRQQNAYPHTAVPLLTNDYYTCEQISDFSKISSLLEEGKVVSIRTKKFTGTDHYMALIDIKDDQIFVGNGYMNSGRGLPDWYPVDMVLNGVEYASYCNVKKR